MSLGLKQLDFEINAVLKHRGFKKKGHMWYMHSQDCVFRIDVQKSSWGEKFYINLGVYLKAIREVPVPPLTASDIDGRIDSLVPEKERLLEILDLENITEAERRRRARRVAELVLEYALPFFDGLSTLSKLRENIKTLNAFLIRQEVYHVLAE